MRPEPSVNDAVSWPRKTREIHSHHFDSTVWNDFRFRDDDIVVATYAKSGTTWVQQMVAQLVFAGDPDVAVAEISRGSTCACRRRRRSSRSWRRSSTGAR